MDELIVKDSNGNILKDGDSIVITKSLKVKGGDTIKQGTVVKNIRLTDDDREIEGKVNKVQMVIKTEFVRKN